MKNVLIAATSPQRFLDQLHLANEISSKSFGKVKIKFFLDEQVYKRYSRNFVNFNFDIINDIPRVEDIKDINSNKLKDFVKKSIGPKNISMLRRVVHKIKSSIFFTNALFREEKEYLLDLENKYTVLSKLVADNKIDVLLLNGDRHLGYEPIFLKIAKVNNIPSIVPYLVDFADKNRILTSEPITKKINRNPLVSRYIIKSQEHLNYKIEENSYYYPHPIANALKRFGVLSSNPYVMGCGKVDILCLNNNYYKNLYIENGVTNKKIRVLGDISYDTLHARLTNKETIREEIIKKYALDNQKKIIVIGLPQLGEHDFLPWDQHWEEINFLVSSADSVKQNILISLHPKMDRNKYEFLEAKYCCKILEEKLVNVLPIADIFVAFYSSTVVWSILCGIKTIVVDFYDLNWTMYDFLTSIKKLHIKDDLVPVLKSTLDNEVDFSRDWHNLSKVDVFDGNTIHRYIDLIESPK